MPVARIVLGFQNFQEFIQHLSARPKVFEHEWAGEKVILLALWQKGSLRPDVSNLAKVARSQGFRVVAVNNKRLDFNFDPLTVFDTYIERSNFGRDFGAYREGVLHLEKSEKLGKLSRLVLLNDSVFFLKQNLEEMLSALTDPNFDFTGATENFEIKHHIGSFALGFSEKILRNKKFIRYWHNYRLTNVRPRVIKRGEMKLSKICMSIAEPARVKALFGRTDLHSYFENFDFVRDADEVFALLPEGSQFWKKPTTLAMVSRIVAKKYMLRMGGKTKTKKILDSAYLVTTAPALTSYFNAWAGNLDENSQLKSLLNKESKKAIYNHVLRGSQIHHGSIFFLKLGLPIVKLDLMYRGFANITDLYTLVGFVKDPLERVQLLELLTSRPYGEDVLLGWRRSAFEFGWL
jgi:hypothetical protein